VVKVIWHKTASLLQTDGSIVFARLHQCTFPCEHIGTTWRIRSNLCFFPSAHQSPQPKRQVHWLSRFAHYNGRPFPSKLPLTMGDLDPSNLWFPKPIQTHNPKGISISSAVFAQMTMECPYTLQWDVPSPPKNCLIPWGDLDPPSNTWFPGPTWVLKPNGISIGSSVFAGLTSVTDWPTGQTTQSVTTDRIYVRSTAIWF